MTSKFQTRNTDTEAHASQLPADLSLSPGASLNSRLDGPSLEHVDKLCEQLLSCSKISVTQWKAPLLHAVSQLDSYLDHKTLAKLARANAAQTTAAFELDRREGKGKGRPGAGECGQGWWITTRSSVSADKGEEGEAVSREKRRELWRTAAMLLSMQEEADDDVDEDGPDDERQDYQRHLRDMSTMSSLTIDEAWLEVDETSKTAVLSLRLETVETTLAGVNSGETALSISFEPGTFEGPSLFGRSGPDLDDDDLKVVERLGGTFRLTATKKCVPRLSRLIEFLAFTVISLRLESVLLDDLGCPRPIAVSPVSTSFPSPEIAALADAGDTLDDQESNLSAVDPNFPGSYNFDDEEPDDDWGYTKRSWRSSFSNSGVLAWMRIANPRAQLPPPLQPSRSLRRHSTIPSSAPSPITLRTDSVNATSSPDSPCPSPSLSPSPARTGTRNKVANKLRGIRNQLRDRIKHNLVSPDVSDDEDMIEDQKVGGGPGGNTSVLGLQIVGVNLKSPSWAKPWSSASEQTSTTEEERDDVSVVATDATTEEGEKRPPKRFEKVIEDLSRFILSTSPDVLYPPPHLLFRLRQQELEASLLPEPSTPSELHSAPPSPSPLPSYLFANSSDSDYLSPKITSANRTSALLHAHALPSSHSLALNFAEGSANDAKQLEPTARRAGNVSTATRIGLDAKAGLTSLMTSNSSLEGTLRHQSMQFLVQVVSRESAIGAPACEPFKWLTLEYFNDDQSPTERIVPDATLATFIRHLVLKKDGKCTRCDALNENHIVNLLHDNEKIEVTLVSEEPTTLGAREPASTRLESWYTCQVCRAKTTPRPLTSIASSFSFAKFIELMLYDPNFIPIPELCEHAATERLALVRYFGFGGNTVMFSRSTISLYELRLPTAVDPDVVPTQTDAPSSAFIDSPDNVKADVGSFFRSCRKHIHGIRSRLAGATTFPSETTDDDPTPETADASLLTSIHNRSDSEQTIIDNSGQTEIPSISQVVEDGSEEEPIRAPNSRETDLLRRLETFLEREEAACLAEVDEVPPRELNLGRSAFQVKAEGIKSRLAAWEQKHLGSTSDSSSAYNEPAYFAPQVLALPIHSSILLRTDEISSILAVALSTPEFKEACQTTSAASSRRVTPSTPNFVSKSRHSSLRLPIPSFASFEDPPASLDPDDFMANFAQPSDFELIAKPKKAARPSGSVFRNLVRKKSGEITGPSTPTSEHGSFTLDSKKRTIKDSVLTDFLKTKDVPTTSNRTPRAVPSIISGLASRREGSTVTTLSLTDDVLAQFASSGSAAGTIRSTVAPSSTGSTIATESSASSIAESEADQATTTATDPVTVTEDDEKDQLAPLATDLGSNSSRLFDGLRSGLDSLRVKTEGTSPRLGSPLEEPFAASEHVKLKMKYETHKYSVTAYFPRRFRDLRAKCGLSESLFVESLSRCTDLNPSGGKSSAVFLMTGNQRFMLKELVTKFGYSELDSLLTFAPRLLDYQMQADRPSLLSKIFGIYSIKIQDLKTGEKKKLDLIVMDNLFHSQTISRQFDLKGIASRVAKPKPGEEKKDGTTGWDSDWLEGSVRNQLLLYPHSRTLLLDSVRNDVEFLSSNGNIDFSLLVGVDDTKCHLVVGLIDTLGVFNTLKVLESSAKKGLKMALAADSSSVTVLPPTEYARRFLSSMETYFLAVPAKFDRPPGGGDADPDPRLASPL